MEPSRMHARRRLRSLAVAVALVVSVLGSALPAAASDAPGRSGEHRPEAVDDRQANGWTWVRGGDFEPSGWTWVR